MRSTTKSHRAGRAAGSPAWGRVSIGLWIAYVIAVGVVLTASLAGGPTIDDVAGPFMLGFAFVGTVMLVRVARRRTLDRRTRRGWALVALSGLVLAVSFVLFAVAGAQPEPMPFPLAADWLRQLWGPVMLAGLLTMPTRRPSVAERAKQALDIGLVLLGGAMLMWYFVVGPVLDQGGQPAEVTAAALAYPLLDLILIFGATTLVFRVGASPVRRCLLLLAVGVTFMVIGDVYLGYLRVQSDIENHGWQFLCWITSCFLIALAASEQLRQGAAATVDSEEPLIRHVPRLPYAAVAAGYGLLLMVAAPLPLYPYGGLVLGTVVMTLLVVARQVAALRDNYRLMVTDSLTGLANRALLRDRLTRALDSSARTGEAVAVLVLDLDKFKEVNDTYGHEAGDQMLVAFSRLLERCVRDCDLVARLGGDEFAVLLQTRSSARVAPVVANRIMEAMQSPVLVAGRLMQPSASIGLAVSGSRSDTVNQLLSRADAAMYQAKKSRTDGSGAQVTLPSQPGTTPDHRVMFGPN